MRYLTLTCLLWLATAAPLAAQPSRLTGVSLSDLQLLPVDEIGGQRPTELSGLAWDRDTARLHAVSDRGRHFVFMLDTAHGQITALVPLAGVRIGNGRRPNAEALTLRRGLAGTELVVADEASTDALVMSSSGQPAGRVPLPEPLRDRMRWHSQASGVEALAWHGQHGLIAAPQRPLRDGPRDVHRVYAGNGRVWAFRAHGGTRSSVKAIELVDARRLLVLEKVQQAGGHLTVLRELPLDACPPDAPCDPPAALLRDARLQADDNFEGLACLDDDLCLLVSDSGPGTSGRTVLALVHLVRR